MKKKSTKKILYRNRLESHRKIDLLMSLATYNGMSYENMAQFIIDHLNGPKWAIIAMITQNHLEGEIEPHRFSDDEINDILAPAGYKMIEATGSNSGKDWTWELPKTRVSPEPLKPPKIPVSMMDIVMGLGASSIVIIIVMALLFN